MIVLPHCLSSLPTSHIAWEWLIEIQNNLVQSLLYMTQMSCQLHKAKNNLHYIHMPFISSQETNSVS